MKYVFILCAIFNLTLVSGELPKLSIEEQRMVRDSRENHERSQVELEKRRDEEIIQRLRHQLREAKLTNKRQIAPPEQPHSSLKGVIDDQGSDEQFIENFCKQYIKKRQEKRGNSICDGPCK